MNLNPGTVVARIATACLSLQLKGEPMTKEAIAVEAWTHYPRSFTMHGFPYPDTNRVYSKLGALVAAGILALAEGSQYRVARQTVIPWPPELNALPEDNDPPEPGQERPNLTRPVPVLPENGPYHARSAHKQALAAVEGGTAPTVPTPAAKPLEAPRVAPQHATARAPVTAPARTSSEPPPPPKSIVQPRSSLLPATPRPPSSSTSRAAVKMTPVEPTVILTPDESRRLQQLRLLPIVQQSQRGMRAPTKGDALVIWSIPATGSKAECRQRIEAVQTLLRRAMQSIGPATPPALRAAIHTLFGLERTLAANFAAEYAEESSAA